MRGTLRGTVVCLVAVMSIVASGCGGGGNSGGSGGGSQTPVTPTVTVSPGSSAITAVQSLKVSVTVSGSAGTATGSVSLAAGSYTTSATALSGGVASITIVPGSLAAGTVTLKASYTPDSAS